MSINLEPIKAQLANDIGGYICLHRDDMASLISEVELLREQVEQLQQDEVIARSVETSLTVEIEHLRGERAAVVAYLRERQEAAEWALTAAGHGGAARRSRVSNEHAVAAIERGEHRREEEP